MNVSAYKNEGNVWGADSRIIQRMKPCRKQILSKQMMWLDRKSPLYSQRASSLSLILFAPLLFRPDKYNKGFNCLIVPNALLLLNKWKDGPCLYQTKKLGNMCKITFSF